MPLFFVGHGHGHGHGCGCGRLGVSAVIEPDDDDGPRELSANGLSCMIRSVIFGDGAPDERRDGGGGRSDALWSTSEWNSLVDAAGEVAFPGHPTRL
jgi:hypothetical protein